MTELETREADVVVVGAGLAGLAAARAVAAAGASVVVLEARDRVGGGVLNHDIGDCRVVEVGGQWIGPGQDRIGALVDELGFTTYPQPEDGDDVILDGDEARRVPDIALGFGEDELVAYLTLVGDLEAIAEQVPLEAPWAAPSAATWDATSLGEWVRSHDVPGDVAGLFAVFHGYAHGAEMPHAGSAASYAAGFMTATALLHVAGIGLGLMLGRISRTHGNAAYRVGGV